MNVDGGAIAQTFLYPRSVTESMNLRQGQWLMRLGKQRVDLV
jgi:hypothetical protein